MPFPVLKVSALARRLGYNPQDLLAVGLALSVVLGTMVWLYLSWGFSHFNSSMESVGRGDKWTV